MRPTAITSLLHQPPTAPLLPFKILDHSHDLARPLVLDSTPSPPPNAMPVSPSTLNTASMSEPWIPSTSSLHGLLLLILLSTLICATTPLKLLPGTKLGALVFPFITLSSPTRHRTVLILLAWVDGPPFAYKGSMALPSLSSLPTDRVGILLI